MIIYWPCYLGKTGEIYILFGFICKVKFYYELLEETTYIQFWNSTEYAFYL